MLSVTPQTWIEEGEELGKDSLVPRPSLSFLYLHAREYSTLTHREEGEPGKESRLPVASDDHYQLNLHMLCITWLWVRVVTAHRWAWFLTRLSLSSTCIIMCQCRIFARV